ncbi:MAG: DUF4268 domain-containing protein [Clostridia bacterium]|nr:DUF4268 domain-containing protein [Clostridia bacterium]
MKSLGKLEEIKDLRDVWPHEAIDFTPWLAKEENINLLAEAVGLEITVDEQESPVGDFSVDIFASETGTERKIIIENQLEDTNHDHLGKLITYASGKSADIIIWVVKRAREEHKAAIEWLNNHTDDKIGFFLCEIKLYRIGSSDPAVKFEVVEKPNDWSKEVKKASSGINATEQARLDYWTAFNEYAFRNTSFAGEFKRRKPSTDHWLSFSIGSSACKISLLRLQNESKIGVEFCIKDDKSLYSSLFSQKDLIEAEIGFALDWRELPDKKASRILAFQSADLTKQSEWPKQFGWLMDSMVKMKKAFKKYI